MVICVAFQIFLIYKAVVRPIYLCRVNLLGIQNHIYQIVQKTVALVLRKFSGASLLCSLSCHETFFRVSWISSFSKHQQVCKDARKIVSVGVVSVSVHLKNSHYIDEIEKNILKKWNPGFLYESNVGVLKQKNFTTKVELK